MRGVRVDMVVDDGTIVKINHQGRSYLPVKEGDRFKIRISNDTYNRVLAVVSVDGLSVMDGKPASHNDSGYVIDPYTSVDIDGYRRGDDKAAEFVVGQHEVAYATKRTGSSKNNGVIGVALFPEKKRKRIRQSPPVKTSPYVPTDEVFTTASGAGDEEIVVGLDLRSNDSFVIPVGTKMGKEIESKVVRVSFDPDESKKSLVVLYYDTVDNLRRRGILVDTKSPNPFPAQPVGHYCPDA